MLRSLNFRRSSIVNSNTSSLIEIIIKYLEFISSDNDLIDMLDFSNQTTTPEFIKSHLTFTSASKLIDTDLQRLRQFDSSLSKLLALDFISYLPGDILTKVDRATMSSSLEGRDPFLDHNLIEWVAMLPDDLKQRNKTSKYLLKQIVHKYVPETIMKRPKMGFSIPLNTWFREDLKFLFDYYLSKDCLDWHGLLKPDKVRYTLNEFYAGNNRRFIFLWNILMFQMWFEKWKLN